MDAAQTKECQIKIASMQTPVYISREISILDAARMMVREDVSAFVVGPKHNPRCTNVEGIVTEADIVRKAMAKSLPTPTPVSEIMTRDTHLVHVSSSIEYAVGLMVKHKIRHLPIIDEAGRVERIIDIVKIATALAATCHDIAASGTSTPAILRSMARIVNLAFSRAGAGKRQRQTALSVLAGVIESTHKDPAVYCLLGTLSVKEVVDHMARWRITAVNVTNVDGEIIGLFTERDALEKVFARNVRAESTVVMDVMTQSPITVPPVCPAAAALSIMLNTGCRHLPVVGLGSRVPIGVLDVLPLCHVAIEESRNHKNERSVFAILANAIRNTIRGQTSPESAADTSVLEVNDSYEVNTEKRTVTFPDGEVAEISDEPLGSPLARPFDDFPDAEPLDLGEDPRISLPVQTPPPSHIKKAMEYVTEADVKLMAQEFVLVQRLYSEALTAIKDDKTVRGCMLHLDLLARRAAVNCLLKDHKNAADDFEAAIGLAIAMGRQEESLKLGTEGMDELYAGYIEALLRLHRYEEAINQLSMISTEPFKSEAREAIVEEYELLKSTGKEFYQEGNYQDSLLCYTSAVRINAALHASRPNSWPRDHVAYANRGACYMQLGDLKYATEDCETAIGIDPTYEKAWMRLCTILVRRKKYIEAVATCTRALQLFPTNQSMQTDLALAQTSLEATVNSPKQQELSMPVEAPAIYTENELAKENVESLSSSSTEQNLEDLSDSIEESNQKAEIISQEQEVMPSRSQSPSCEKIPPLSPVKIPSPGPEEVGTDIKERTLIPEVPETIDSVEKILPSEADSSGEEVNSREAQDGVITITEAMDELESTCPQENAQHGRKPESIPQAFNPDDELGSVEGDDAFGPPLLLSPENNSSRPSSTRQNQRREAETLSEVGSLCSFMESERGYQGDTPDSEEDDDTQGTRSRAHSVGSESSMGSVIVSEETRRQVLELQTLMAQSLVKGSTEEVEVVLGSPPPHRETPVSALLRKRQQVRELADYFETQKQERDAEKSSIPDVIIIDDLPKKDPSPAKVFTSPAPQLKAHVEYELTSTDNGNKGVEIEKESQKTRSPAIEVEYCISDAGGFSPRQEPKVAPRLYRPAESPTRIPMRKSSAEKLLGSRRASSPTPQSTQCATNTGFIRKPRVKPLAADISPFRQRPSPRTISQSPISKGTSPEIRRTSWR